MSNPIVSLGGTLVLLLISCGSVMGAQRSKWIKFTTPHFELYTDAGERKGRDALKRLDQLRQVLQSIPQSRNAPSIPVRIYLFGNDGEYRSFKPSTAGNGFHLVAPDRDYLIMRGTGGDTYRTIFHEYAHVLLSRSTLTLPRWIEEGTAEYYSMTEPDGKLRVKTGKAIPAHRKTARTTSQWITPEALQALRRDSAEYREQTRSGIVYAQSWIMIHQLISSERYRAAVPRFSELLTEGTAYAPAFLGAFGVPLETAWKDLALYARANRYREMRFTLTPDQMSQMRGQRLTDIEITPVLADLQLMLGNDQQAEAMLNQPGVSAETAEVARILGFVALRSRNFEEAKSHFEKAVEQNANLAAAHFGLAMAIKESGGNGKEIAKSLENCVRLSPSFAEGHYILGQMARDSKQYEEAAGHFERAAAAYPRRAVYWHSLAAALHELKQTEAARRAAYKAYFASATAEEFVKVTAILDLVDSRRVQIAAKKSDVSTAATLSDKKGDTRLDGTLIRVDCIGESARFHVLTGEKRVLLHSLKPQEIALKNSSAQTREFECGPQKRLAVSVEYNARPDARLRSAGDVVAIEFKAN